jgi:DNA-binding transcriptional MerR regulator
MDKSPDAFRTISEVSEHLDTPAHVLRFWESRFPQIRPVKRAGGRRYYRPSDVALLSGIKRLLHDDGLTIRGVQKILREQGIRHVASLAGDGSFEVESDAAIEAALVAEFLTPPAEDMPPTHEVETAQIIALQTALTRQDAPVAASEPEPAPAAPDMPLAPPAAPESPELTVADTASDVSPDDGPSPPPLAASGNETSPLAQDSGAGAAGAQGKPADAAHDAETPTIAARLRRCAPHSVAQHQAELIVLRDRLRDLRGRLAAGARRRPR